MTLNEVNGLKSGNGPSMNSDWKASRIRERRAGSRWKSLLNCRTASGRWETSTVVVVSGVGAIVGERWVGKGGRDKGRWVGLMEVGRTKEGTVEEEFRKGLGSELVSFYRLFKPFEENSI